MRSGVVQRTTRLCVKILLRCLTLELSIATFEPGKYEVAETFLPVANT